MTHFHGLIRSRTRASHDLVDALFGAFDLTSAVSYVAMLRAHARALLPIEAWMSAGNVGSPWTPRGDALRADLRELGETEPEVEEIDWPMDEAAHWGTAYVLEGSRLGGAMLARQVGADLPRAYLGRIHAPGGWRHFLSAFESRAGEAGTAWQDRAIFGAQRAFASFADAARAKGAVR